MNIKYQMSNVKYQMGRTMAIGMSLVVVGSSLISMPVRAFAEDASSSAAVSEASVPSSAIDGVTPTGVAVEKLLDTTTPGASAMIRSKSHIRNLTKKTYKAEEAVTLVVDNASLKDITAKLFDAAGTSVPVEVTEVSTGNPVVLKIAHTNEFKPGRYHLEVSSADGVSSTQNFTWGVLAINPNKSIYSPHETAHLAIAVLDETGEMVCNSNVKLQISNVKYQIDDELSTENGKIVVNPECRSKEFTLKPDYEASYEVGDAGVYSLTLSAETEKGKYTTTDSFEVRESVPFEIERTSATRIFPPLVYPMRIDVTAGEDFTGTITEHVPGNFLVKPLEGVMPIASISAKEIVPSEKAVLSAAAGDLSMPFDGKHPVSLGFGKQLDDPALSTKYSEFGVIGHDGIDFDMPDGTPVLSVDDGEVVKADPDGDYGQTVVIQHVWGKSYYGHLSLITGREGQRILKGHPLGMSGHSGLSTGPHLHFGIKPNLSDPNNGYYGKVDPAVYLGIQNVSAVQAKTILSTTGVLSASTSASLEAGEKLAESEQIITWNVSVKKGQKFSLGYTYKVPNISPQFYLLGPLQFSDISQSVVGLSVTDKQKTDQLGIENGKQKSENRIVFTEPRQWQLAIDADGSGTNTVTPTTGSTSTTGNTYTFTFTAAETMDSGAFRVSVPSGWTAPQGTNGVAGYTTVTGNGNATTAIVENNADNATLWTEDDTDMCTAQGINTTTKIEGTGSVTCTFGAAATDNGDTIGFHPAVAEDWSSYTDIGFWIRSDQTSTNGGLSFFYDDSANGASALQLISIPALTANQWTYVKGTLTATRTSVADYGIQCTTAGNNSDCGMGGTNVAVLFLDEILLGPSTPTFSGQDITVRILDAANTETFTVTYGSGGGSSGVINSSTPGVHTFTTASKTRVDGTITNFSSGNPTVTLSSGPALDQLMRHGKWFSGGVEQPFTF